MKQEYLQFDAYSNILTPEAFKEVLNEFREVVKRRKALEDKKSNKYYQEYQETRDREMLLYCNLADFLPYCRPSKKIWDEIMIAP